MDITMPALLACVEEETGKPRCTGIDEMFLRCCMLRADAESTDRLCGVREEGQLPGRKTVEVFG